MSCLYKSSEGSIHMLISQQLFDHREAGRFTYSSLGLEAVSMELPILCKLGNMVQCQEDVGKGYAGEVFDLKLWAYFPLSVHSTMLIYKDRVSIEDAPWTIALAIAVTYVLLIDILFLRGSWTGCVSFKGLLQYVWEDSQRPPEWWLSYVSAWTIRHCTQPVNSVSLTLQCMIPLCIVWRLLGMDLPSIFKENR